MKRSMLVVVVCLFGVASTSQAQTGSITLSSPGAVGARNGTVKMSGTYTTTGTLQNVTRIWTIAPLPPNNAAIPPPSGGAFLVLPDPCSTNTGTWSVSKSGLTTGVGFYQITVTITWTNPPAGQPGTASVSGSAQPRP